MRKFICAMALAAMAVSAPMAHAEEVAKKPSFKGFSSNSFWANWELSVGAGASTAFASGDNIGARSERIGFEASVSMTKWLHPVVGLRGQLQGGWYNNFHPTLGKMEYPSMFAHIDVMVNFSNWVGGYREDRVYYAVPYIGGGYLATNFTDDSQAKNGEGAHQAFSFAYGLLNKFRVCKSLDIDLELKGLFCPSHMSPTRFDGAYMYGLSATVGLTYRFGKRDFTRTAKCAYSAEDIKALQDAVARGNAALDSEKAANARLNGELESARAAADAAEKRAAELAAALEAAKNAGGNEAGGTTGFILYNIGSSQLTAIDKTRLELLAEQIKEGPADRVYRIVGYADQQTGSSATNARIAESRAKGVYDFLVKHGVKASQLEYEGLGNVPDIFKNNAAANRITIIK